jgi:hypothetical protein
MLLRFQKAAVQGNYETGNQAFSMHLRFLTIRHLPRVRRARNSYAHTNMLTSHRVSSKNRRARSPTHEPHSRRRLLINQGNRNKTAPFAESIWITCCSGRRQISKTSCSISGPTSTTIARIPHWKGEHPIRRRHDQSQISARLDGSPIVDPHFRPQWVPHFSNIRAHCGIRSGAAKTWNEIMRCLRSWLQCVSRLRSFQCHQVRSKRERHLPFAARFAGNISPRSNSPDTSINDAAGLRPPRWRLFSRLVLAIW